MGPLRVQRHALDEYLSFQGFPSRAEVIAQRHGTRRDAAVFKSFASARSARGVKSEDSYHQDGLNSVLGRAPPIPFALPSGRGHMQPTLAAD
jgi:hypothetical protein